VGTYNVSEIQVQDNSGNIHYYHPADLGALGIASSFALTTAVPAAVMITSVTDDVPLLTGALSNGAHTNDPDRQLASGGTRGGVPFTQGPLFYILRNRFYLGEVKFKGEILPGSQPALLDRALFDAVQQRLTEQWSHRTTTRIRTRALLAGLLFDDAGHRMILTYSSRDCIRHRYYVSAPCIRGQTDKPVGSVTRVPASEIEVTISKAVIAPTRT